MQVGRKLLCYGKIQEDGLRTSPLAAEALVCYFGVAQFLDEHQVGELSKIEAFPTSGNVSHTRGIIALNRLPPTITSSFFEIIFGHGGTSATNTVGSTRG